MAKSNKKKEINPFIQSARAHYDMFETKEIIVEEWLDNDGMPTIFYSTAPTLAEKKKILDLAQGDEHASLACTLIVKAKDSENKKVFTMKDKHALMNLVDPEVVALVAYKMCTAYSSEEMGKK